MKKEVRVTRPITPVPPPEHFWTSIPNFASPGEAREIDDVKEKTSWKEFCKSFEVNDAEEKESDDLSKPVGIKGSTSELMNFSIKWPVFQTIEEIEFELKSVDESTEDKEEDDETASSDDNLSRVREPKEMAEELRHSNVKVCFKWMHVLGYGGFGSVFKVQWQRNKKIYAMKYIRERSEQPSQVPNEINIFRKTSGHPLFLKFYCGFSYEFDNGTRDSGIITEFFEGDTLYFHKILRSLRQVNVKFILYQLGCALKHLHSLQIIHRDVKSGNVLINKKNLKIKLIDFGISKKGSYDSHYCGTLPYVAPEMMALKPPGTGPPYSYEVDYFAVGALFFDILYDEPPPISLAFETVIKILLMYSSRDGDVNIPEKASNYTDDITEEDLIFMVKLLSCYPKARPNDETYLKDDYFTSLPTKFKKMG